MARLLEKTVIYFTKIQFEVGTGGRMIEQTGKTLQVKDKYITNV